MAITRTVTNKLKRKRNLVNLKDNSKPNFVGWYTSTSVTQTSGAIVEPYLPLFAQKLGASSGEIGLLAGLFSLINLVQILWAHLSLKYGNNRLFVFLSQSLTALLFIPIALLQIGQFFLLLVLRFFQGFLYSANFPSMASLQSEYISDHDRASKITTFTYLGLIGSLIGIILGGLLFDYLNTIYDQAVTFSIIFIFTGLIGITGALIFNASIPKKVNLPKIHETVDPSSLIDRDLIISKSVLPFKTKVINYIIKFKSFWIFTLFAISFYYAIYMIAPFFIIIEINHFEFSFLEASIFTAISIIPQVIISIFLIKYNLMNTYGRKPFLVIGVILINVFASLFLISQDLVGYIGKEGLFLYFCSIWFVLGIGWGLFNSTMAVLLLDIAHPQYRALLVAIYNALIGLFMFLGPLTGGILIDSTGDLFFPLVVRIILSVFAFIYLLIIVKEPIISGLELKPLKNVFPFLTRISSTRGPELSISYGNEKLVRKKHL